MASIIGEPLAHEEMCQLIYNMELKYGISTKEFVRLCDSRKQGIYDIVEIDDAGEWYLLQQVYKTMTDK